MTTTKSTTGVSPTEIHTHESSVKFTRFRDIPPLTPPGNWQCNFGIESLIQEIDKMVAEQGLNLDPDFQRLHVWTEAQQIAWIEFFLRGGITGRVIYLNQPDWPSLRAAGKEFVLVDGKQRLQAIRRFVNNEITAFGSFRREFTDSLRMHQTMLLNVNCLPNRASVLRWYLEFNSGGTQHTAEEIEKARVLLEAELAKTEAE